MARESSLLQLAMWAGLGELQKLLVIFIGFGATVLSVTQGEAVEPTLHFKDRLLLVAPPLVFLTAVLFLGLYLPPPLRVLLEEAAALLEVCR